MLCELRCGVLESVANFHRLCARGDHLSQHKLDCDNCIPWTQDCRSWRIEAGTLQATLRQAADN